MCATRCIVRAFGDEPLERVAVSYERGNVFVVATGAVDRGDLSGAIGFPESHVRSYDAATLRALQEAYQTGSVAALWDTVKPLSADLPLLERAR